MPLVLLRSETVLKRKRKKLRFQAKQRVNFVSKRNSDSCERYETDKRNKENEIHNKFHNDIVYVTSGAMVVAVLYGIPKFTEHLQNVPITKSIPRDIIVSLTGERVGMRPN